ncbi:zinc finger protein constans-like 4 [Phtheirospermum japonicum]|uniref:Zinc finger protein constans-like 4 n=1 Tax=Phtheirospermum japonicum TaxID=374723 RepID=A0A830B463_9LAMI|nr:zinc finger protein constans-like 4 [Phtheirospermum japonicum]
MGGETWSLTAKLCDSCKTSSSAVFCRADSAFLCVGCDAEIYAANKLASRHARAWVCEVCEQAPPPTPSAPPATTTYTPPTPSPAATSAFPSSLSTMPRPPRDPPPPRRRRLLRRVLRGGGGGRVVAAPSQPERQGGRIGRMDSLI